jgi:sulfoxide reductase catalytic subunit YedY
MPIINRRPWDLPESAATPIDFVMNRRNIMRAGLGAIGAAALAGSAAADTPPAEAPPPGYQPAAMAYDPGRPLTPMKDSTTYNNFYEFGLDKDIWQAAQKLPVDPWSIQIEGMVSKPFTISFDDLMKKVKTDTRIYRHRCVETWAMTVPWTGFPLSQLVSLAQPLSSATYIKFWTLEDDRTMTGLSVPFFPWPYREGLTMAEATNELAFIATGMYNQTIPKQDGAPLRLVTPWKYGFKSIKSIVKISFVDKQPETFWQTTSPSEYGFWANVNPAVPHPRWSQAHENLIGTDKVVPTQIYNGYGQWVAPIYAGMKQDRALFM